MQQCLLIYLEGLYFDGKKCNTLVRETKCVNVQVDHLHLSKKNIPLNFNLKVRKGRGKDCHIQAETTGTEVGRISNIQSSHLHISLV